MLKSTIEIQFSCLLERLNDDFSSFSVILDIIFPKMGGLLIRNGYVTLDKIFLLGVLLYRTTTLGGCGLGQEQPLFCSKSWYGCFVDGVYLRRTKIS